MPGSLRKARLAIHNDFLRDFSALDRLGRDRVVDVLWVAGGTRFGERARALAQGSVCAGTVSARCATGGGPA